MERLTEYLENNLKLAYKSVTFHFKKYVWFYIAIFIVQSALGIISFSSDINTKNIRETVEDEHKSHYVFYYMNVNQKLYLQNAAHYYFKDDYYFYISHIKEYGKENEKGYKCDVYITFLEDPSAGLDRFNRNHLNNLESFGTVYSAPTPLFTLENDLDSSQKLYNVYLLIISAFSFILLTILYNIKSSNDHFDYGIYMAFGADKKKLLNTSFWEMTVIALLTFIPSALFSGIFCYVTASLSGFKFSVSLSVILKNIIYTLILNGLSVSAVIVKTALKTPVSLITSQDNSNLVHSPRVSVNILKHKNFGKLTSLSRRRYVKYYAAMIVSGILFPAIFVCGIYCSEIYLENLNTNRPQYEISFNNTEGYTEEDRELYLSLDGISGTYKELYTHAMGLDEHILINKSNAKPSANRVVYNDEYLAMDNVVYYAADMEVIENLTSLDYSGDLNSIYTQEDTIIINESFNNTSHLKFEPGDKIKIADYYSRTSVPDYYLTGKELLKERLRCFIFKYKEYTVGAVIHDDCSDENLKIYMNTDLYESITDDEAVFNKVFLYTEDGLSHKRTEKIYSDLLNLNMLKFGKTDGSVSVFAKNLYTDLDRDNEKLTVFSYRLVAIAVLLLLVSSIVWFFSQTLFYGKRNNEYTVLRAVGFNLKEIRMMFLTDAVFISAVSLMGYALLSHLMCYGVYKFMNSWLFYYNFRYSLNIPSYAFWVGCAMTVAFAFTSTVINYSIYKKKTKNTVPNV